jgi:riboflavin biosynthesis pyrimidine reductase
MCGVMTRLSTVRADRPAAAARSRPRQARARDLATPQRLDQRILVDHRPRVVFTRKAVGFIRSSSRA